MGKSNNFYLMVLVVIACGMTGCKKTTASGAFEAPSTGPGSGGGGGGGGTTPATPTTSQPLTLTISTKYDNQTYTIPQIFTETGTDDCVASATNPTPTCTLVIPEGRLYFSSLILNYSRLPASCPLLVFKPYYYQASSLSSYIPPNSPPPGTAIDCSTAYPTADCFGGPAIRLVPSFPTKKEIVHQPNESDLTTPLYNTAEIVSAFSIDWLSNRHTANDLATGKRGSSYTKVQLGGKGDGYVASSMVDYTFECHDHWYDLATYVIHLKITDEDTSAAGTNDFLTWREAP